MTTEVNESETRTFELLLEATRATNALLLAGQLGLDLTDPVQAQRVMRHLEAADRYVNKSGSHG